MTHDVMGSSALTLSSYAHVVLSSGSILGSAASMCSSRQTILYEDAWLK